MSASGRRPIGARSKRLFASRGDRSALLALPATRVGTPRAALLLAGSGARHVGQPAGRRRGPEGARPRLRGDRQGPGRRARRLRGQGRRRARCALLKQVAAQVRPAKGFYIRPSQAKKVLTDEQARRSCSGSTARSPRTASTTRSRRPSSTRGNNDRVVIMPGRYTEPESRQAPLNDPTLQPVAAAGGRERRPDAELRATRSTCPNDQNLVYVQGRKVVGEPQVPPLEDRQGIPAQELGKCVRCNLQIEGSGAQPTDVIIDGGRAYKSKNPEAKPGELVKDVIIRADRADGFVVRNLTTRGALEHGIYVEETDGYRIERAKMFWAADYGNLTFTSDHGLYKNCDSFGAGDAALYPGAAPGDRLAGDRLLSRRAADQHGGQEVRHARQRARLLGLDGQRGADHQQPHLRQHDRDRERHALGRRPPGLPGRQLGDRQQPDLLEQPRPLPRRTRRSTSSCRCRSGPGSSTRA